MGGPVAARKPGVQFLQTVLLFSSVLLSATSVGAMDSFGALDVFELEYAADPRISPDGQNVIYERRALDVMTDATRSSLWIIDSDGDNHRPLLADGHSYSSPRWSPDGGRVAYVAAAGDAPQLYVRWLDSTQTALVSDLRGKPENISWSPDGRWLAFTMEVPAVREPLVKPPKMPEGAQWAAPVNVIDSVVYRFDGRGFLTPAHRHVFVVSTTGGTAIQLTSGEFNHGAELAWSPDSEEIFFAANREANWEYDRVRSDLYKVRLSDGALTRLTSHGGARAPAVAPSGGQIAYLSVDMRKVGYRITQLMLLDVASGEARSLSADLDRSVADLHWATDGKGIYFAYNDRGRRLIAYTTLRGTSRVLTDAVGGVSLGRPYVGGSYTVSADGRIAFTLAKPDRPSDVAVLRRGSTAQLTRLNEDILGRRQLGEVHGLSYRSSVGDVPIQSWYITPPDFDPEKTYPLILELHGGPHSAYGATFSAEMQLLAAAGYIVFFDNYRGSTSYGEDFALLLQYKYSSPDDFADHMSGIDVLIAQGVADPANLFITGGSAGGIATLYAIGLTDRFNAAAAAKPIANWISKTLTGDIYTYQIAYQFPGLPWDEFEHYWQRSPLSLVGSVVTPTMLITGEADYRTPISETEQYYQALKLARVDTVMVRVPEASHGIAAKPSHLIAKVNHILAWFERYRKE